jgi:hypothetical protein
MFEPTTTEVWSVPTDAREIALFKPESENVLVLVPPVSVNTWKVLDLPSVTVNVSLPDTVGAAGEILKNLVFVFE